MPPRQDHPPPDSEPGPSTPDTRHGARLASARSSGVYQPYYSSFDSILGSSRASPFPYSSSASATSPTASVPITADGRYLYPSEPSTMSTSPYDYAQYNNTAPSATSYDSSLVLSQLSLPPLRNAADVSSPPPQLPPQSPYSSSAHPYPSPYNAPAYTSASHWTGENWTQSTYTSVSDHSQFNSARADESATGPSPEHAGYASSDAIQPEVTTKRGVDSERRGSLESHSPTASDRHNRGLSFPSHGIRSDFTSPPVIDFNKLLESYRLLMDVSQAVSHDPLIEQGRVSSDNLDNMLRSARLGLQQLHDASSSSATRRKSVESAEASRDGNATEQPAAKRQKIEGGSDGQVCLGCNATTTPEWRRGPMGPRTLCNACGLVYAKMMKKRARDANDRQPRTSGDGRAPVADEQASGLPATGDNGSEDGSSFTREPGGRSG